MKKDARLWGTVEKRRTKLAWKGRFIRPFSKPFVSIPTLEVYVTTQAQNLFCEKIINIWGSSKYYDMYHLSRSQWDAKYGTYHHSSNTKYDMYHLSRAKRVVKYGTYHHSRDTKYDMYHLSRAKQMQNMVCITICALQNTICIIFHAPNEMQNMVVCILHCKD